MFTSYAGVKADIQGSSLILTADKTSAKLALGAGNRIIDIADISAISITLPSGLKNGVIMVSDATGRSELHFLKKQVQDAQAFFNQLSAVCPSAVDVPITTSLWPKAEKAAALSEKNEELNANFKAKMSKSSIHSVENNANSTDSFIEPKVEPIPHSDFSETRGNMLWNCRDMTLYETTITNKALFSGKIKNEYALDGLKEVSYVEPKGADLGTVKVVDTFGKSHKISSTITRHQFEEFSEQMSLNTNAAHIKLKLLERAFITATAINTELIGELKPESILNRMSTDTKERIGGSGGSVVKVYKTFISQNGINRFYDKYVTAELIVHGQIQVTHRPTLTRMALTAPLPGPALAWGLALAKQKTHDSRQVLFTCTHPEWTISLAVDPDKVENAKALTMRINSICERISEQESSK